MISVFVSLLFYGETVVILFASSPCFKADCLDVLGLQSTAIMLLTEKKIK